MCGALLGERADGGRDQVGEGKGEEGAVEGPCCCGVVLAGDVEGEVDERLAVALDEGGEAA